MQTVALRVSGTEVCGRIDDDPFHAVVQARADLDCVGWRVKRLGLIIQGVGCRVQGEGCRMKGAGWKVQRSGFTVRVKGSGFGVQDVDGGCRAQVVASRVSGTEVSKV